MHRSRILLVLLLPLAVLTGCREETLSHDSSLRIEFSCSKLSFDTVFTTIGSATKQVMVYNHNASAVELSQVWLDNGSSSYFHINLDGENSLDRMGGMRIRGGDSLFMFVRIEVDPQNVNTPVNISDALHILVNGNTCTLDLEAIGQDVVKLRAATGRRIDSINAHLNADKPYLLYDSLCVSGTFLMDAGARLYMHDKATLVLNGDVQLNGTLTNNVSILGDRIDRLFDSVPYAYAAGGWNGIFLTPKQGTQPTYNIRYASITSGTNGLIILCKDKTLRPTLHLHNSRIHNHSQYGVVLDNVDDSIVNCEISNCADHCLYLGGGNHVLVHTTVAAFYNHTTVRIQATPRKDVPAVMIDNKPDDDQADNCTWMLNCLVAGTRLRCLEFADTPADPYPGRFVGNYLQCDSVPRHNTDSNTYGTRDQADAIFVQSFYRYREYKYYNFRLANLSPAGEVADSLTAVHFPTDRLGLDRRPTAERKADPGCYRFSAQ